LGSVLPRWPLDCLQLGRNRTTGSLRGTVSAAGQNRPGSTRGGHTPRWRQDGKEIFYLGENDTLVAVAVRGGDSAIELGDATPLFQARFSNTPLPYAVAPDGQRFLINRPVEDTTDPPITLVVNWPEALKK
jgi:hypothetical protein